MENTLKTGENLENNKNMSEVLDELINIDDEIENQKRDFRCSYFANIDDDSYTGAIDIPLIFSENNSDFCKIRMHRKNLQYSIGRIDRKLEHIMFYTYDVLESLDCKNLSEEEKNKQVNETLEKLEIFLEKEKKMLENELVIVKKEPKRYLKCVELETSDLSEIKDNEERCALLLKKRDLLINEDKKNILLRQLTTKKKKENKKLSFCKKHSKKI